MNRMDSTTSTKLANDLIHLALELVVYETTQTGSLMNPVADFWDGRKFLRPFARLLVHMVF